MTRALIVVDVQNDFCEGGSLAVAGGASVAAAVAGHIAHAADDIVVATADWHEDPGAHWSPHPDFRDSWPVHCKAGTDGAQFHPALEPVLARVDAVFRKGRHEAAYSGFQGRTGSDKTGNASDSADGGVRLADWLRQRGVDAVDVVGIATDHCVRATALDAIAEGFRTRVLLGMTAGVSPASTQAALDQLRSAGAELVGSPIVAAP